MAPRVENIGVMPSRFWQATLVTVAAAASVATSQAPESWSSRASQQIETVFFDSQQRTKAVYVLHAEVSGKGPYKDLGGLLSANVLLRSTSGLFFEQRMRVTLTSLTNPEQQVIEEPVLTGPLELFVDVPAWTHCALPPCTEDFELTVELLSSTTDTGPLEISGRVESLATGDDWELEHTTTSTLTVSLLP